MTDTGGAPPRFMRLLLVAGDPGLQAEARQAASMLGVPIDVMPDVDAALAWLLVPERLCTHVLAEATIDPARIDSLAGMVDEVTSRPTPLLLLGAEEDRGPAVVAVPDCAAAAIAAAVREFHLFEPPELPEISADALRSALHAGMMRMRFQPVLDARTLEPRGLEALARIHHPRLGILAPRSFMPQAEESGQERALTGIAAARTMLELRSIRLLPRNFSMNTPLATLCHSHGVERALELLALVGVEPARLVIEVLETLTPPDMRMLAEAVQRWRQAGFRLMIDDAGPRLPHWLAMLDLPFNGVKLDTVLAQPAHFAMAANITAEAKKRGLYVVAEGIEDVPALERLRGIGVDAVQGFLFCRPLPARAIPLWMTAWEQRLLPRPN